MISCTIRMSREVKSPIRANLKRGHTSRSVTTEKASSPGDPDEVAAQYAIVFGIKGIGNSTIDLGS